MPYPKPLSEKSIARLYGEAGLEEKQIEFLRTFFSACANLYGAILAVDAWDVYRELSAKTVTVPLRRRDMYAALGIMRRENLPFYVFEIDEVYSKEDRQDRMRLIAHRELIRSNYGKFYDLYTVVEKAAEKPFYIPENLMSFVAPHESAQEQTLLRLLNNMRSTRSKYTNLYGKICTCPYKGKYLRDFSYISDGASFELNRLNGKIEGCKGNPKKAAKFEAELKSVTAAQYLVNMLKSRRRVGNLNMNKLLEYFFIDLTAMGVNLSHKNQIETLLNAVTEMCNNSHLWCNHGWKPSELLSRTRYSEPPTIGFGKGLQKAFEDGSMDRDELVRTLREMGFKCE